MKFKKKSKFNQFILTRSARGSDKLDSRATVASVQSRRQWGRQLIGEKIERR